MMLQKGKGGTHIKIPQFQGSFGEMLTAIIPVTDFLGGGIGIKLHRISIFLVSLTITTGFVMCRNLQQVA